MFGDFGPRRGIRSIADTANTSSGIGHAIKFNSLGFDSCFLRDASARGGCGRERTIARDDCALETLSNGEREGFAFGEELAFAIESFNICIGQRQSSGEAQTESINGRRDVRGFSKNARKANWAACAAMPTNRRA